MKAPESKSVFISFRLAWTLFLFWACVAPPAQARQQLSGHLDPKWPQAALLGPVEGEKKIELSITLPLRNQVEMQSLLKELYDSHSPQYRHFLTRDEFTRMFGPTQEDYAAVVQYLQSQGFRITKTQSNRSRLSAEGTAADVQRVFHLHLNYRQRRDGTAFFAPDSEPSLDLDVPLLHVTGLNNYDLSVFAGAYSVRRKNEVQPAYGTGPQCGSQSGNSYLGNDLREIYAPCTSLEGEGQTVDIVEMDTFYPADINEYAQLAGDVAPTVGLTFVMPTPGMTPTPSCCDTEPSLDIEMVLAMAPKAVIQVYYVPAIFSGNSSSFALYDNAEPEEILGAIADQDDAKQISDSWFWGTTVDSGPISQIFDTYAMQGQTFFVASGDKGAYISADPRATPPGPMWESSKMTVVGGTILSTSGTGTHGTPVPVGIYQGETAWNESPGPTATLTPAANLVSSGGFCDNPTPLPIPTYQTPFVNVQNQASTVFRNIPDVSAVASNLTIVCFNGSVRCGGGTSAAAPLWAGFLSLANEQGASQGLGSLGDINPTLYTLALNPTPYANDFNDIQDGSTNNYWYSTPTPGIQYQAVKGYDLVTGLGSPKCNLLNDLVSYFPTGTPTPTVTPTPTMLITPGATPVLGPNISRNGESVCLFLGKEAASGQWVVFTVAGEKVASLTFGNEAECWKPSVASGYYIVRIAVKYRDGTSYTNNFPFLVFH